MSEYTFVAFRAIDGPVTKANLEFIERQSTRADITPWSFENEYHYGDFRGDPSEMLRRGFDFHLHYANYGIRHLMIRLPHGLPSPRVSKKYLKKDGFSFKEDKRGPAGILCVEPYIEPGELDDLHNIADVIDRLLPLRAEILGGDLRPFYIAHLAVACDGNGDPDEQTDAPVPAGLDKLTDAQQALAELYGVDECLLAAAAEFSPPRPETRDLPAQYVAWLRKQPAATKAAWLMIWSRRSSRAAAPATPRTIAWSDDTSFARIPRPGIEPGLAASKTAVRPTHSRGSSELMPLPGIEPGLQPSEGCVLIRHTPRTLLITSHARRCFDFS